MKKIDNVMCPICKCENWFEKHGITQYRECYWTS